ncbi:transposase [mine drainage metagenome]|uniref:Transposase n=1 Tax=mine drainage metagenome TaxID=410659 RepID=T1ARD7_9ZZZZ
MEERHRSLEFVKWLELVDGYYSGDYKITIILDNHSVYTSRETMKYLSSRPWRFHFVFTSTHASWLNIIEMFFSKMARSMLRGIRVDSKDELKEECWDIYGNSTMSSLCSHGNGKWMRCLEV